MLNGEEVEFVGDLALGFLEESVKLLSTLLVFVVNLESAKAALEEVAHELVSGNEIRSTKVFALHEVLVGNLI